MQQENNSSKMGTQPIGKLLFFMSIPAMLSMFIQAGYSFADGIFVSKVSENAFRAVSIAFPLQMLIISFAAGTAIGTSSLLARKLGEGDKNYASEVAKTGIFLSIITCLFFVLIGIFFSKTYISMYTTDQEVIKMGTQYLMIVMVFSIGVFIDIMCARILQSTGNMLVPMLSQIVGAATNVILDAILIFGLLGFPKMGVMGAAIATVIGQIFAALIDLAFFFIKKQEVSISLKGFRPKLKTIGEIYVVAVPVIAMQSIGTFTNSFLNGILASYNEIAVSVLGVFFKIQGMILMPIIGISQGALPILSYNFGAKNKKRFTKTFYLASVWSSILALLGFVSFQLFTQQILFIFEATPDMIEIGTAAIKATSYLFLILGFNFMTTTMFQSVGNAGKSFAMSFVRQLVFLLPSAWIFGKLFGLSAIWFSFPFAEVLAAVIFLPIGYFTIKKKFVIN